MTAGSYSLVAALLPNTASSYSRYSISIALLLLRIIMTESTVPKAVPMIYLSVLRFSFRSLPL